MPKSKRNWATLFSECPFKVKKIYTEVQIQFLAIAKLAFNPLTFSSCEDKRVKYNFVSVSRERSGVFLIKQKSSNFIVAMGSSCSDLYEQILLHIRRYQIDCDSVELAIILAPTELVSKALEQIKYSYLSKPIDPVYNTIAPLYKTGKEIPIDTLNFFPLFDYSPKSIRHVSRIKTNIAHLQYRPGVYFIKERENGATDWELVYIGKASNLNGRIYAHFVKSQMYNQENANYYLKRDTYEYSIGVIEIPIEGISPLLLEEYFIKQCNPRDNRKGKIDFSDTEAGEWFDIDKPFWKPPVTKTA